MSWYSVPPGAEIVASGWLSSAYSGGGILGSGISSTGLNGNPSPLYGDLILPADANKEYRWQPTPPSSGTFTPYEDGSFYYLGPTTTFTYIAFEDYVTYTPSPVSVTITVGGTVPVIVSGNATNSNWTVSGEVSIVVPPPPPPTPPPITPPVILPPKNYVPTNNPYVLTRAITVPLRNEFLLIAAAIQTKMDTSSLSAATWSGIQDFLAASMLVAPPTTPYAVVSKQYIDARAFNYAFPDKTGTTTQFVTTTGSVASFAYPVLTMLQVTATTQNAVAGEDYLLTNAALTTVTAPASPLNNDVFSVTALNGLYTNVVNFGSASVVSAAGTITGAMTLDLGFGVFIYKTELGKWVMK